MKIIPPIGLSVASTGTEPADYVHEEWVQYVWYHRYDIVRCELYGVWYSFMAKSTFYEFREGPNDTRTTELWEFLGESPMVGGINYDSGIALSLYGAWTSGAAVSAGAIYYDPSDRNDYVALIDITSGNNTVRPSAAVVSADEAIAARWQLIGAANAFAMVNYTSSVSTKFIDPNTGDPKRDGLVVFNFSNPSANLIEYPNRFTSEYWTADLCSVTRDVVTDPIGNGASADVMTAGASASVDTPASIWRDMGTYASGDQVVFGVFLRSYYGTSCVVKITEESSTDETTHTFNVANSWQYVQVAHTVGGAGTDRILHVEIGFLTSPGNSLRLWGAHFGLVADCFDHIALMGVRYAARVRADLYFYSDLANLKFSSCIGVLERPHSELRQGLGKTVSIVQAIDSVGTGVGLFQSNTGLFYATQMAQLWVACEPASSTKAAEIRSLVLGQATTIGYTEWGVETSMLSFSRKERDDNFGTVKFVKRGSAISVRATAFIDTDQINADEVYQTLAAFDGQPIAMDFNNPGSDYERLKLFGFYTNMRTIIQADSYESLGIDVESLVQ